MGIRVLRARGRCVDSGEAGPGSQVGDADFEGVVLDKAHDTFVLFYRPHPRFCASNGTAYAAYAVPQPSVKVCRRCVPHGPACPTPALLRPWRAACRAAATYGRGRAQIAICL